jgi:hypothetical protein
MPYGYRLPDGREVPFSSLVSGAGTGPIAVSLGAIGQSLPFGAVLTPDASGVGQRTLYSAPSQGYIEGDYRNLAVAQHGSYITKLIQKLAPWARVFHQNGCLGSSSLSNDYTGVLDVTGWEANKAYRGVRAADTANGDPGHKGQFILESGHWWEAYVGCDWLYFYNSDTPKTVGGVAWRRQLTAADAARNTNRTSSTAKPTFPSTASQVITAITKAASGVVTYTGADPTNGEVKYLEGIVGMTELNGQTITVANVNTGAKTFELGVNTTGYGTYTSGGLVHPTVADNGAGSTGGGIMWRRRTPGANNNADGNTNAAVNPRSLRVMRTTDPGWDPMGAVDRMITAIRGAPVNANNMYCLIIGTVQSDAGKDTALVAKAMQMLGNAMANVGIKPIHTGCAWNPASTTSAYDLHETALSGGGIATQPNVNASSLKLLYDSQMYVLGNPGVTGRTGALYYMLPSLYRLLGQDILHLLQTQPNPHFNDAGTEAAANAWVDGMRKILLNTGT